MVGIICDRTDAGFGLKHIHQSRIERRDQSEDEPESSHREEINFCRRGFTVFHVFDFVWGLMSVEDINSVDMRNHRLSTKPFSGLTCLNQILPLSVENQHSCKLAMLYEF